MNIEDACEMCNQRDGQPNVCRGDNRLHGHGCVHVVGGGLYWLCEKCAEKEANKWKERR